MAKREYFRISDFSGGYNPDRDPTLIADNEAVMVRNIRLDETGSIVSRRGWNRYYDSSNGYEIQAMGRWRQEDDPDVAHLILKDANGRLRQVEAGSYTTLDTGLSTTARGEFHTIQNFLAYVNGVDRPRRYDGTNMELLGIDNPASAPSVSISATGGTLSGTFKYKYTYYDSSSGAESSASAESSSISPSSQAVDVDVTASSEGRVDQIRIYRTNDGGSTFLLLTTIANATTTYTDTGSASLATLTAPINNTIPGNFEHIAYHKGYGFGAIGNTLYWSKALDVDAWPQLNSTDVPFEGNDTIQALVSHQDTLLIFGRENILLLAGQGGNWTINRMDVSVGLVDDRAVASVDGKLVFLDYDGIKVFPGFQQLTPNLNRELAALSTSTLENSDMIFVPQERSLYLRTNGKTYVIHTPNQAVSIYEVGAKFWLAGGESGFEYPLFVDSSGLYVNQYGVVTTDNGAAIPILWRSKQFLFNNPELTKAIRRVGTFASKGSSAAVTVTIADNERTYTISLSSVSSGEESIWDSATWDSDTWTSEGVGYFIGSLPAQSLLGRVVQVDVTADVSNETKITPPITLEYRSINRFL